MSSTAPGINARRGGFLAFKIARARIGIVRDLVTYLVETPLAAIFALWAICLPALYFALYGDIIESAKTLSFMTAVVMAYTLVIISSILLAGFAITTIVSRARNKKWSDR